MDFVKWFRIAGVCGLVLLGGLREVRAAAETVVVADRAKVTVIANDVTVDGKPRPDIAQALVDGISAGLLKQGDYRVFQAPQPAQRLKGKGRKGEPMLLAPSQGMARAGDDVDFAFTVNLVGQDEEYRMTVKKVRHRDNEVIEVHELAGHGKLDRLFGMVPDMLKRLQARAKEKPVFPRTQSPAELLGRTSAAPAAASAPATSGNSFYWTTRSELPPEYANIDFSKVPKALVYQRIGAIQFINEAWKFCIIRPTSPARIGLRDSLHVLYDENGRIYADLTVSRFDSGRVIADFGNRTPGYRKLFPGDEVFGWAPPVN